MGFCIGGKACRRQACKDRCKGWFGAQPDVERACKNACKSNSSLEKEDFLCSGNWIDQRILMAAYGYDPCEGDQTTIGGFLDPTDQIGQSEKQMEATWDLLPYLFIILLIGLGILFYTVKK
jgi:hypothetical protein